MLGWITAISIVMLMVIAMSVDASEYFRWPTILLEWWSRRRCCFYE